MDIMNSRTDQFEHVPGAVEVAAVDAWLGRDSVRDEILRKIGRNLLLFQQIEGLLKVMVAVGKNTGNCNEFWQCQEGLLSTVSKKTMGPLVGEFVKTYLTDEMPDCQERQNSSEAWFSIRFQLRADDSAFRERRKKALDDIVTERNELAHHLLPRWNVASHESTQEMSDYLDVQRDKALAEFQVLRDTARALESGRQRVAAFLASDEFAAQAECEWLRQSRLVTLLEDILEQHADSRGCVLLNVAGQLLKQQVPEDYAAMQERYGFKSLKPLILAVGMFEIVEERTTSGGTLISYRLRAPQSSG